MRDTRVGILGLCGWNEFRGYTHGELIEDIPTALKKDILIFTGGEDISPSLYGENNWHCGYVNKKRDLFEKNVLVHALGYGVKVLGICRGHQLINAVLGGKLYQDIFLETNLPHGTQSHNVLHWTNYSLESIFPRVNSLHHQAVSVPGQGLDVIMRSDDGLIEATSNRDGSIVTFQFHPEWLWYGGAYFENMMETGKLIW